MTQFITPVEAARLGAGAMMLTWLSGLVMPAKLRDAGRAGFKALATVMMRTIPVM